MSSQMMTGILLYGLAINLLAYAAMVLDKVKAEHRVRRIPEATLLKFALLGGSVGAIVAQLTIRHKTRKEPFRSRLVAILAFQVLVMTTLAIALVATGSPEKLRQILTF